MELIISKRLKTATKKPKKLHRIKATSKGLWIHQKCRVRLLVAKEARHQNITKRTALTSVLSRQLYVQLLVCLSRAVMPNKYHIAGISDILFLEGRETGMLV